MTTARKTQIGLVVTALVLFVLLFIAPKKNSGKSSEESPASQTAVSSANVEPFLTMALKTMKPEQKVSYEALLSSAKTSKVDTALATVVEFWDQQKRPDFAAYFVEQMAGKKNTSAAYTKAGDRYYYSVRFIRDASEVPVLYASAMRCYQKALDKNAANTEAKIQLAACMVEEGKDPMKGIGLLREVEKTDSNNVKLQLTFAFFSVRSQQWDRAIKRFNKVLSIDPLYLEAYLHLADAYEQQGQKENTIEMLEKYASLTDDAMARQEVLKYIEQLKNK